MKERQRWKPEEDALLRSYVRQYGPREWNLVSQRMNVSFNRDAKSCLERWKNYLKPGIKKGSLTEEEQHLVIRLQAKHGNKWKKIAAEIPGRTAKRLGKWWEVFKEKQQRELKENGKADLEPLEEGKYDQLLENFAEKLVKERQNNPLLMATPILPSWLSNSNPAASLKSSTPSVTLTLSSAAVASAPLPWLQQDRIGDTTTNMSLPGTHNNAVSGALAVDNLLISEVTECCRELEEGHKAWMMHKKETAWRLKRVELQIDSEKARKKREKIEEIQSKIRALEEEQKLAMERIEAEYKEQLVNLRRDAEAKEQKLAEQWASKHACLMKFLEQMGRFQ